VLWGDAGKMIVNCCKSAHPSIKIVLVGSQDYTLHHYAKYYGYVSPGPRKDRVQTLYWDGLMVDFINSGQLQGKHVISNYVPYSTVGKGLSHFFCLPL